MATFEEISNKLAKACAILYERGTSAASLSSQVLTSADGCLWLLTKTLGDLSLCMLHRTCYKNDFDHQLLRRACGAMLTALISFSEAVNIYLGYAAEEFIQDVINYSDLYSAICGLNMQECYRTNRKSSKSVYSNYTVQSKLTNPHQSTTPPQRESPITQKNGRYSNFDEPLSPGTTSNFFPALDQLCRKPREEFNNQKDLGWIVVNPKGNVIELKPNGIERRVTYDELPEYLALVEKYRPSDGKEPLQNSLQNDAKNQSSATCLGTRANASSVLPAKTDLKYYTIQLGCHLPRDVADELAPFSPTHFAHDLFTPCNEHVPVSAGQQVYQHEFLPRIWTEQKHFSSFSQNQKTPASPPFLSDNVQNFWKGVAKIYKGEVSLDKIKDLGLNFTLPKSQDTQTEECDTSTMYELCPNGKFTIVCSDNVDIFIKLLKEKLGNDFSENIEQATETNELEGTIENRASDVQSDYYQNVAECLEDTKQFIDIVRGKTSEYVNMLQSLSQNSNSVTNYKVTWCMPASLVVSSDVSPESFSDGIFDLRPNGRYIKVRPEECSQYLERVVEISEAES